MFSNRILCMICGYADELSKSWAPGPESWAPLEIYISQERIEEEEGEGMGNKEDRDRLVRLGAEIGNAPFIAQGLAPIYVPGSDLGLE